MENSKSSFSLRAEHCSECVCVKLYLITSKHSSCFCVLAMTNHCQKSKDIIIRQCFLSPFLRSTVPKAGDHFLLTRFYLFPGQSSNHPGTLLVFPQSPPPPPTGFEICCMSYLECRILLSYLLRFLVTLPYFFQSQLLARDNSVPSEIVL